MKVNKYTGKCSLLSGHLLTVQISERNEILND